jgi:phosphate transport system substrate-binding protein
MSQDSKHEPGLWSLICWSSLACCAALASLTTATATRAVEGDTLATPLVRIIDRDRVLAQDAKGGLRFVLLDREAAPTQWQVGETRRFHLIAVNEGEKPMMLPAISDIQGEAIFGSAGETLIRDPSDSDVFVERPDGAPASFRAAAEFVEVVPGASVGVGVTMTPVAPGPYRVGAVIQTNCTQRESTVAVFVAQGVARPGRQRTPVPGAWTGFLGLEASLEVAAEPAPVCAAKRTRLGQLFDDPAATDERRIAAFKEVVAGDDWHSWTACRDALDRPTWRAVHDLARDRIRELYEWGMPGVEWQDFLDRVTKHPEWQSLRPSTVPLVATVAQRYVLEGSKKGGVVYWPNDETAARARELLTAWTKDSSGALAGKARAALAELPPVPLSAEERTIAGHGPGTPIPEPIAMPEGPLTGKVVVSIPWSMYYLPSKAAKALQKDAPKVKVEIHLQEEKRVWERFDRKEVDVLALGHAPRALDRILGKRYPDPAPWPSTYWFGDSVAAVVVHPRNPLTEIDLTQLRRIFIATDAPKWDIVGGKPVQITRYGDTGGRTGEIISEVVAGGSSFRNKTFHECESAAELIEKVAADPQAIGFLRFGSDVIDAGKKVKLLAVQSFDTHVKAVLPSMATISDDSYVLRERMTLLMQPDASPASKAFCATAARLTWKEIGETSGFWPTSEILRWRVDKRLEQAKAGKGVKLLVAGPPAGKRIMDALCLELTRSDVAVTGQYGAAADAVSLRRFVEQEADLLVTDGPLSEEALAPHAKEWASLAVRSVPIGSQSVALVVHPANKVDAVTIEQVRDLLTGKVKEWSPAPPGGTEIKRFGPPANDDGLSILAGWLAVPRTALKIEHRRTADEIMKAVAADPRAVGIISVAEVPGADSGVRVLPVAIAGAKPAALGPTDPGYPLARTWILHVRDRAKPAARLLADRLAAGAWGDAIRALGLRLAAQIPK